MVAKISVQVSLLNWKLKGILAASLLDQEHLAVNNASRDLSPQFVAVYKNLMLVSIDQVTWLYMEVTWSCTCSLIHSHMTRYRKSHDHIRPLSMAIYVIVSYRNRRLFCWYFNRIAIFKVMYRWLIHTLVMCEYLTSPRSAYEPRP